MFRYIFPEISFERVLTTWNIPYFYYGTIFLVSSLFLLSLRRFEKLERYLTWIRFCIGEVYFWDSALCQFLYSSWSFFGFFFFY